LLAYIENQGWESTLGEVQRTKYQQEEYVRLGKSWTMNSNHIKKCAADIFLWIDGNVTWKYEDYKVLGDYWKTLDERCAWGGDWKSRDSVHFEVR
jgi:peptidoglycan L-alanyl-D-glutamate endopeptidase CwlK